MTDQSIRLDPRKPTILICSDSPCIHTGLARVTRAIFGRLWKKQKYNIVQQAWFHHFDPTEKVPWQMVSTELGQGNSPKELARDAYGQISLPTLIRDLRPDIVFAFHDPWHLTHIAKDIDRTFHLVSYTCVDSEPMPIGSKSAFELSDILTLFGSWAKETVLRDQRFSVDPTKVWVIPHGVETQKFRPLDADEKARIKKEAFGIGPDTILIGSVGRNQVRKNLGRLFQLAWHIRNGYYLYCKRCLKYSLYEFDPVGRKVRGAPSTCTHCTAPGHRLERGQPRTDVHFYYHGAVHDIGWDMQELLERYQLQDVFHLARGVKPTAGASDETLAQIYNAMDIFTLPTTAEGFGLPILEAMSCGVPVILPEYSAYMDWAKPAGLFCQGEKYIESGLNCERIQIHMHDWLDKTLKMISDPDLRLKRGMLARHAALDLDWEPIAERFDELFSHVLAQDVQKRYSMASI